jgi:hypothetical protein
VSFHSGASPDGQSPIGPFGPSTFGLGGSRVTRGPAPGSPGWWGRWFEVVGGGRGGEGADVQGGLPSETLPRWSSDALCGYRVLSLP